MAEMVREHFPSIKVDYRKRDDLTPSRGTLNIAKGRKLIGFQPSCPLEKAYPEVHRLVPRFLELTSCPFSLSPLGRGVGGEGTREGQP